MNAKTLAIESIKAIKQAQSTQPAKKVLTDEEYKACRDMYNALNEEFWRMSTATIDAYFDRLFDIKNRS